MGVTKNQKKNSNKIKIENKKFDEKVFKRIKDKFKEYWMTLFRLTLIYIIAYLFWSIVIVKMGGKFAESQGWNGDLLWFVIVMIILQGLLFCLDGWVTALLKSPFNQMCYAINKAEGLSDKKKDYIITKATESNEHCKETLKKFGIITIAGELAKSFIAIAIKENKKYRTERPGEFQYLMVISYLIPIGFAAFDIWLIRRELKKIEKSLIVARGK